MHGDAWSPQRSQAAVNKRLIAASRLPYLLRDHHRVIVRPRNGLDMRTVSQIRFAKALAVAAALSEEEVTEDVVCPNMMQNIAVISTPAEWNARAYSKITAITLGTASFDVSAYRTAPDDTCKGIIREEAVCRGCGMSSPSEDHVCTPECKLCGGAHLTADKTLEETSYRYQPLQAAALRLSARAAAGARVTSANSYNNREGDPVPEAEQGAVRDPEDILDPRAVLTHGCLPSAMVCSKEISTRPGHPRSRAPNHRAIVEQLRAQIADLRKSQRVSSPSPSNTVLCTEATSDASRDEVPMDVHPGAKPTKRRALAQPANNADRDFKTEVKETLNDIKNALRAVVESIAVLDSRVTNIETDQVKALQSAEATPAQVIPKVRIVQKVATCSVSQEIAFEGPNNGGTP
ncbi:hypothetical protein HPB51_017303 [Rhipicephalus microplus]|uniref:Uncharacterized protein n=1 Tax=Rhipicephalus microplus TaxID=6941 RepID=A0A9J6ETH6_RHIMP|nr:hypothetical protein HPB51_017303 [Rhipicephalus microplus]